MINLMSAAKKQRWSWIRYYDDDYYDDDDKYRHTSRTKPDKAKLVNYDEDKKEA